MSDVSTPANDQALEERLEDLVADLLSRKKYQGIVQRLFAEAKGTWVSVKSLCSGFPNTEALRDGLDQLGEYDLLATWLDYPGTPEDAGQALIVFFAPASYWSKAAFYNRNVLPTPADGASA